MGVAAVDHLQADPGAVIHPLASQQQEHIVLADSGKPGGDRPGQLPVVLNLDTCRLHHFKEYALLFGGEVNAEVERSRELRQGRPASARLLAPRRSDRE